MTLPEIKNRWPVAYRAWQLTGEGNDRRQVGALMGLSRHTVSTHVNRVREALAGIVTARAARAADKEHPLATTGPRCHCGLLPPHECLPTVDQVASSRHGESAGTF